MSRHCLEELQGLMEGSRSSSCSLASPQSRQDSPPTLDRSILPMAWELEDRHRGTEGTPLRKGMTVASPCRLHSSLVEALDHTSY